LEITEKGGEKNSEAATQNDGKRRKISKKSPQREPERRSHESEDWKKDFQKSSFSSKWERRPKGGDKKSWMSTETDRQKQKTNLEKT